MKEKHTKGTPETEQGLNEGNPNTERTTIDPRRMETALVGGVTQSNFEDEQKGDVKRSDSESDNAGRQ
jgi:hypothetical protein